MSRRELSESDICDRYITPAIIQSGWNQTTQVRREYGFTDGRITVRGKTHKRGPRKRADYLLSYQPNLPLAVVEAKDAKHNVGDGMQQALGYADSLDIPFVFSSNGDGFLFHDRTGLSTPVERQLSMSEFPSPEDLWSRYQASKGLTNDAVEVATEPLHDDFSGKEPRYYQRIAIQRATEAIARGQSRVLLAMATGTGKTYTAFHIIWRLWQASKARDSQKSFRTLFITDRNVLVDQTMTNDFKPFGQVMTKVSNRTVDKSYEVYLSLYQAVSGTEEEKNIYKQFSPDFFDLVVIDECHRGSAREASAWREILDYFSPAIQLGMTATPKETKEVSTLSYFGDPVYTYSLKQGIDDGFLAPYKVVRIDLDKDLQGWRPAKGMTDDFGQEIEDRVFNQRDMDRALVLNERTKRVAEKVVDYMLATDPYGKTIVFCENIDHAERMRSALVNEVAVRMPSEAKNLNRFVVRITGDSDEGKRSIDDFIHPERTYPVIATTSKLLSTGVDAKTCKLIVLDQNINSMIEFKQTVGRGTRIHEDTGKLWFSIIDFRKVTELFADPDFDGEPEVIWEPDSTDPVDPPDVIIEDLTDDTEETEPSTKYVVSGVEVNVIAERVQYYGPDGQLITESLQDYTRKSVFGTYRSLDDFLVRWDSAERKRAVVEELEAEGVLFDELRGAIGKEYDPFDLVCHVVYDRPPLTRKERAEQVRKRDVFSKYGDVGKKVLDALLDKYADDGLLSVEDLGILRVSPISDLGTPVELVKAFGGRDKYIDAVSELEKELYTVAA